MLHEKLHPDPVAPTLVRSAISRLFPPMKKSLLLPVIFLFVALGLARADPPAFDPWADDFAARWVALNPQFATRAQYFTGATQDALDRQLILGGAFGQTYGVKAARARAELAKQGLAELQRYPAATLTAAQRTSAR